MGFGLRAAWLCLRIHRDARRGRPLSRPGPIGSWGITEETVLNCLKSRRCSPQALGLPLSESLVRKALPVLKYGREEQTDGGFDRQVFEGLCTLTSACEGMHRARPDSPIVAMKAHCISVCICTFKRAELLRRLLE